MSEPFTSEALSHSDSQKVGLLHAGVDFWSNTVGLVKADLGDEVYETIGVLLRTAKNYPDKASWLIGEKKVLLIRTENKGHVHLSRPVRSGDVPQNAPQDAQAPHYQIDYYSGPSDSEGYVECHVSIPLSREDAPYKLKATINKEGTTDTRIHKEVSIIFRKS